MKVYLNGALVDAATARIDPADRGFTLGDGLFETMCVKGGKVLRVLRHLARLRAGAATLGMPLPWSDADLQAALAELLAANGLSDASLRLTVSRGVGPRGLLPPEPCQPTLVITAGPLPPPAGPVRAILHGVRNEQSPLSGLKTLAYAETVFSRLVAHRQGADDAIMVNTRGWLAESTISNLFLVIDGDVLTPPLKDGALPGIMRADVMDRLGAAQASLTVDDLWQASEAFLTNALGVRPLVEVDGRAIGDGQPGPVTRRLLEQLP